MKEKIIDEFFKLLEFESSYYSLRKGPLFIVSEKQLYDAITKALAK